MTNEESDRKGYYCERLVRNDRMTVKEWYRVGQHARGEAESRNRTQPLSEREHDGVFGGGLMPAQTRIITGETGLLAIQ